jgi:uncharacterized membrane protein YozB (DUF420 family)
MLRSLGSQQHVVGIHDYPFWARMVVATIAIPLVIVAIVGSVWRLVNRHREDARR